MSVQDGRTALIHAVMGDKTEAFAALLAAHADIEAKDKVRNVHCLAAYCDFAPPMTCDACQWRMFRLVPTQFMRGNVCVRRMDGRHSCTL